MKISINKILSKTVDRPIAVVIWKTNIFIFICRISCSFFFFFVIIIKVSIWIWVLCLCIISFNKIWNISPIRYINLMCSVRHKTENCRRGENEKKKKINGFNQNDWGVHKNVKGSGNSTTSRQRSYFTDYCSARIRLANKKATSFHSNIIFIIIFIKYA